jgi:hypothetical protein
MSRPADLPILRAIFKKVWAEKYRTEADILKERPGSPGIFDVDVELAEHIDRIYTPRLERLKRMIAELEATSRGAEEEKP